MCARPRLGCARPRPAGPDPSQPSPAGRTLARLRPARRSGRVDLGPSIQAGPVDPAHRSMARRSGPVDPGQARRSGPIDPGPSIRARRSEPLGSGPSGPVRACPPSNHSVFGASVKARCFGSGNEGADGTYFSRPPRDSARQKSIACASDSKGNTIGTGKHLSKQGALGWETRAPWVP